MEEKIFLEIGCIPSHDNTNEKPNTIEKAEEEENEDLKCLSKGCSKTRQIRPPLKYRKDKVVVPKKIKKERVIKPQKIKPEKKAKSSATKLAKSSDPERRTDIVIVDDTMLELVQNQCKSMGVDGNYERLLISLQSPFPNEHEFALNVCMVLSAEETKNLNILGKTPALLNMILAHVGFYQDCGLRHIMEQTYKGNRGCYDMDFSSFWNLVIGGKGHLREILCECHEKYEGLSEGEKVLLATVTEIAIDEEASSETSLCCEGCQMKSFVIVDKWDDGDDNLKVSAMYNEEQDKLVKRIHRVGEILRNFSFESDNASVMANNGTLMRFLLTAGESDVGSLPHIALDIWCNISNYIKLSPGGTVFSQFPSRLLSHIKTCVYSNDRFKIIRSLELIPGLAKTRRNRRILKSILDEQMIRHLFTLLALSSNNEFVVINCLETILSSTLMGKAFCDLLVGIHGAVKILVTYLSFAVHEWWSFSEAEEMVYSCDVFSNSVRLTAALCLRNLAQYSQDATRLIQHHELHLAQIAMNGYEYSNIVAQVLYHLDLESSSNNRIRDK